MKKTLAALLVCGASVQPASAQSNVEIYGVLNAGLSSIDSVATPSSAAPRATARRTGLDSGQYTQSRFGFRGTEDLGGGLKAYFALEGGLSIDTGVSGQGGLTFGRKTVVGLEGRFGEIEVGRRKDYSDEIAGLYSTQKSMLAIAGKAHGNNLDRVTGDRGNNMVYYTTPTVAGVSANLAYGFGESAQSAAIGQSIGLGANYEGGPFGVGFSYWQSKLGNVTATSNSSSDVGATSNAGCNTVGLGRPGDKCVQTWMVGSKYALGGVTLRGSYSQSRQPLVTAAGPRAPDFNRLFTSSAGSGLFAAGGANNREAKVADVGLDYIVGRWKLKASVIQARYDFVGAARDGRVTTYAAGADYNLSKRALLFAMLGTMRTSDMYSPGLTSNGAPGADRNQSAILGGLLIRF